ncbi:MAG: cytochrome bc complex cytochrome b subunit [Halodesulfurarchaeum sp.]|nr:cytochrome bc complex cytochrome b subunit [Halodesulfurarchaeum sp.]
MIVGAGSWLNDRLHLDDEQGFLGKAFPAEDSFLLGEVALFSFVTIVLTGIFLGVFYEPSTADVLYQGVVDQFQGEELPASFVSVLHITYGVPFGMFIRRLHHWGAHLFIASIALHMMRVFFTGAYRNPREINWVVGMLLAVLAMGASYTGYALPFDEFGATATGIGYNLATSVPVLGDFIGELVFAGEFPAAGTIPRLFFLHVLVIPLAIIVLLAVHMTILVRQKHTEGDRSAAAAAAAEVSEDDDSVVLGLPAYPNQAAVGAVVFLFTAGTLSLLAGFLPVHNIVAYGPNDPASTPAVVMPDWFLMWVFGFLKVLPSWTTVHIGAIELTAEFWAGILFPTLVIGLVVLWPFIDRSAEPTHFTADPLDAPRRTAVGVAGISMILVASLAGMNNLFGGALGVSTTVLNPFLLWGIILVPIAAGILTYVLLGGRSGGGT